MLGPLTWARASDRCGEGARRRPRLAGHPAVRQGQPYGEDLTTKHQERSGHAPAGRSSEQAVAEVAGGGTGRPSDDLSADEKSVPVVAAHPAARQGVNDSAVAQLEWPQGEATCVNISGCCRFSIDSSREARFNLPLRSTTTFTEPPLFSNCPTRLPQLAGVLGVPGCRIARARQVPLPLCCLLRWHSQPRQTLTGLRRFRRMARGMPVVAARWRGTG
jgi:hypothetical protein